MYVRKVVTQTVGKSKERTTNTAQYPISNTFSPLSGWQRKFLLLVLALMIWAALSSAVFATCGTTLVNIATGSDTPGCGTAASPCRTISWARQRAQSCSVVTRIFTVQGNSITLAEVVLPPAGTGDYNTPAWLRPIFPFFGFLLNPSHYTTGIVDLSQ
ncbi:MAG: hypothetical protein HY328_13960 [Chloroflexi bacterium]|nr:hypothetical protein [Chloroflexota bacterium]